MFFTIVIALLSVTFPFGLDRSFELGVGIPLRTFPRSSSSAIYPRNLEEADQDLEKTAHMLFDKIRATIPMISQSITGRGKMIVETAVKNDTARCFPRRQ